MRPALKLLLLFILLSLCFTVNAQAKLRGYTYPYDISQIEWQILNWTAAFRETTTPGDPFILERFEYDRNERKVLVYLKGKPEEATDENLKKSVDGVAKLFQNRFTNFDIVTDAYVYYKLKADDSKDTFYKEYKNGSFSDRQSPPEEPKEQTPAMMPAATSY